MSFFSPEPKQKPKRLPRRTPLKTVPSGIGDEGIVGNWLFYYLKGGDHLHDFSPEDNHSTINGASWKDGRYGWALNFDGVDDYVKVADSPLISKSAHQTMVAWVKLESLPSDADVAVYYAGGESGPFSGLGINTDGTTQFQIRYGGTWYSATSSASLSTGKWYMLTGTLGGGGMKNYINASQDGSDSNTNYTDEAISEVRFACQWYTPVYLDGTMAIVQVYDVTKSGSWIKRRFERTRSIFGV